MEQKTFIKESIVESLSLDHENYENLLSSAQDACQDNKVNFDINLFRDIVVELVNTGQVIACQYSKDSKNLEPQTFDGNRIENYWFQLA